MPNQSTPDIFIEEISSPGTTITGVATSIAAFIGRTAKGPVNKAVLCGNYAEFLQKFGGAHPKSDLAESVKLFFENGGGPCYVIKVSRGSLRSGVTQKNKSFYALDKVDIFNLMILPGDRGIAESDFKSLLAAAGTYCLNKRAFLLIDAPESWMNRVDDTIVEEFREGLVKKSSAVFYPRVQIDDAGITRAIGASGAMAAVIARTDSERGVWKAPAGIEADLRAVLDVELNLTDAENGRLNQLGVNCIRKFPDRIVNWGARTLDGADDLGSEWKYIPIRRMALFLEESLIRGTQWVVFEENGEPLWIKVRLNIMEFMTGLFRQGAFQGSKPEEAFFVKCDSNTMTQNGIDSGIINIQVGFAPFKPGEFIVLSFQHKTL